MFDAKTGPAASYECVICGREAKDEEVFGNLRAPWGWEKDEQGSDRCPRHTMPCPECGEVKDIVRVGCASGCRTCATIWVKQTTMLSAPLFDSQTITRETLVVTNDVYKKLRQGCMKFDIQCVIQSLEKK